MFPRLLLGYVIALPILISVLAGGGRPTNASIVITMSSSVGGSLQVFYDSGRGFSANESSVVPLQPSPEPREYRLPLPPGVYHHLRVDPANFAGTYTIQRAAIVTRDGSTLADIPLAELAPAYHLSVAERSPDRLALNAEGDDPQLLYSPPSPLAIRESKWIYAWPAALCLISWGALVGLLWLLDRSSHPAIRRVVRGAAGLRRLAESNPRRSLMAVAVFSTIVATYPVLFLGQSFVAPNNGAQRMLYHDAPFVPGSADVEFEDTRGSDVSATMYGFVPYTPVEREALASGELPLWNRYNAAGRPLWGQGVTFLLDPLHWLTFVTPDPSVGWDLKFVAHRIVFAFGIGLAGFVATGAWLPAATVAGATPFLGFYSYWLNHPGVFSLSYAPFVLLGWLRLARANDSGSRSRATLLLAVSMALVLFASPPKQAFVILLGLGVAGAVAIFSSYREWRERRAALVWAALACATFILLTALQWFVFLDALQQSLTAYDNPYAIFASARDAVSLFLGPLTPGPVLPGLNALFLVLIVAAFTSPRQIVARPAILACAIASGSLVAIAFGAVPSAILLKIPFIANIGHIYDVFLAAALTPLLVMSVWGATLMFEAGPRRTVAMTLAIAIVSGLILVEVVRLSAPGGFEPWAALLTLLIAGALPWTAATVKNHGVRMAPLAAFIAAVAVLVLPGGLHVNSGLPPLDMLLSQPRERARLNEASPAVEAIHRAAFEPGRTTGLDWALFSGAQALYDLEGLGGPDPLQIPAYEELINAAGIDRQWIWFTMVRVGDVDRLAPLLDMLNVKYFLARSDYVPAGFVDMPVPAADRLRVGLRGTAWPRAFFVDGVTTYSNVAALLDVVAASGKPLAAVQADDRLAREATDSLPAGTQAVVPASDYALTANTTTFRIQAPSRGVVVLSEAFVPNDFLATINGERAPYFRVNHAFKGIVIPAAGEWVVKFQYRPRALTQSAVLTCLGIVLLSGLGVVSARSRRHAPATVTDTLSLASS